MTNNFPLPNQDALATRGAFLFSARFCARVLVVFGLLAVQGVFAQTTCDSILLGGVFNLTTIDSRKTVQDNLYEWLKTTEWEQFKGAQNSGLKVGFPINGVPVEFSGSHSEDKFREWRRAVDQGRIRNFSSEEFLQIVQRSASTEIVNAWLECVKTTSIGLSCSATTNGEMGITLSVKFSPNSITDYPPTVLPNGFQIVGAKAPVGLGPGSEIPLAGASLIITRDAPISAVTIVINTTKGSCQRFLPSVADPIKPPVDLPALKVRTFQETSSKQNHPEIRLTVPAGYKIISGGCRDNFSGFGNMLTGSYPESERTWVCLGKDHGVADPSTIDIFVTAIEDPSDQWIVYIGSSTSAPSPVPVATAVLPVQYVMTGGGAIVRYRGGQMLTASMPEGTRSWTGKAKQHVAPEDFAPLTAYVIGIRPQNGADIPTPVIVQNRSGVSSYPTTSVEVDPGFVRLGCGAFADWRTQGSLLTSVYPSGERGCVVSSKDHQRGEATTITAYALGIKFVPKACEFQIGPDRFTFGPNGGTATITISTTNGCAVPVSTGDYWVQVNPKGQMTGSQTITLTIPPNTSPSSRTGAVSVAGRSLPIQQESAPVCMGVTARLGRVRFDIAGGSAIIEVVAPNGCPWTAITTSDFVTIRPASGQGSMNLELVVSPNRTTAARTATLAVAGTALQLAQDGVVLVCTDFVVRLASNTFDASGGSGTVEIGGRAGCSWTAKSSESFVSFAQTTGQGPGKVTFTVGIHSGTADRTAVLTVAGTELQLTQRGSGKPPVVQDPDVSILVGGQFGVKWLYGQAASGRWFIVKPPAATTTPGVGAASSVLLLKGIDAAANDIAWKPAHAFAQSVGPYPAAGMVYESVTVSADSRSVDFGRLISQTADPEVAELGGNRYPIRWFYFSGDQDKKWYIANADQASTNSPAILMLKAVDPKTEGQILWKPIHNFPASGDFPAAGQRFDSVKVASDGKLILFGSLK